MNAQFEVAGVKYRLDSFRKAKVKVDDTLTLKPEPTNEYDPLAIAVYKDNVQLGYVPRSHNQELQQPLKECKEDVKCQVISAWPAGCWVRVTAPQKPKEKKYLRPARQCGCCHKPITVRFECANCGSVTDGTGYVYEANSGQLQFPGRTDPTDLHELVCENCHSDHWLLADEKDQEIYCFECEQRLE